MKLTNKQRVLRRYPRAWSFFDGTFFVYRIQKRTGEVDIAGTGDTPRAAWASAARNLTRRKRG